MTSIVSRRDTDIGCCLYLGVYLAILSAFGCRSDGSGVTAPPDGVPRTSIVLVAPSALEPLDTATIRAEVHYKGLRRLDLEALIHWQSSDTTIATVDGGRVRARSLGPVSISASIGADTTRTVITVAWRTGATLRIYPELGIIEPGVRVRLIARAPNALAPAEWSSSDASIASIATDGTLTGVSTGSATLTARFAGLFASLVVRIAVGSSASGFGYAYTAGVPPLEDYGNDFMWSPPSTEAYSTSGSLPRLAFVPPYPARPDFGWLRPGDVRSMVLLHAVSLEGARCRVYVEVGFWTGAATDCWDGSSANRFETIAATPDAFTGPVALIRPEAAGPTSSGVPIVQRTTQRGIEYDAPGFSRESSYTFVTSASKTRGGCAVAPMDATLAQATALVLCADREGAPALLAIYAIVLGEGATRGGEARVFAELDETGAVLRQSEAGIHLTSARSAGAGATITLAGDAVAQHGRLPAVLLTPVSRVPQARCWITQPVGAGTPQVTFTVSCDPSASGVLIGATY